jgi:AbrB family looped-hinge helix DNA binding protein
MELSLTTLSPNGQIVIPSEIRKKAGLTSSSKFLVFCEGGTILLKLVTPELMRKQLHLTERLLFSEQQIKKGKLTKATTTMSDKDIDTLLMQ